MILHAPGQFGNDDPHSFEYSVYKVVEVPGTCAESVIMGESSPKRRAPMRSYFVDAVLNLFKMGWLVVRISVRQRR